MSFIFQFRLTLLVLRDVGVVGVGAVFARGQRAGEKHVVGVALVLRVGEAGIPAPAAQRLV